MDGDHQSDAERLIQCFRRGVSQRSTSKRSSNAKEETSINYDAPRQSTMSPDGVPCEVDECTPKRIQHQTGISFNRPTPPDGVVAPKDKEKKLPGSAGKQVSPGVFYGSPLGRPANKPQILRLLNEIRNEREKHSRDVEPATTFRQESATRTSIWATFPRQEQAIQFAESHCQKKLVVFQYQDPINGQRRFLATSYEEFWERYSSMAPDYRHHYEIIQEGKPCHLYFDLEFNRRANSGTDGETLVNILLSVVQQTFLDVYALHYEPSWTMELDSSTKVKPIIALYIVKGFLVVHTCGQFDRHFSAIIDFLKKCDVVEVTDTTMELKFCSTKSISLTSERINRMLSFWKGHESLTERLDDDKFSRHLIIHVPRSAFKDNSHVGHFVGKICKKIHQLQESDEDLSRLFVLQGESHESFHTSLFVDQAVYSRNRSFRLPFSSKAGKTARLLPTHRFRCRNLVEKKVLMESLICRVEDDCERLLTLGPEDTGRGGTLNFATWKENPTVPQRRPGAFCISGKSPFPALDIFVESVACIGNIPGRIRSWYWFAEYGVVVYNISDNRYCENVGRPHKSNNVMYIVDFRTAGYYQKCHDPDCRGYRSPLRPIPRHTIPSEFPLSTAHIGCNLEQEILQEGRDKIRLFGEEWDDEKWWEEVVSTLPNTHDCLQPSQDSSQVQSYQAEDIKDDDEWWSAAEPELEQLENLILTQRK